jgi:hypothetical protein
MAFIQNIPFNTKNYYKHNYYQVLENLIPKVYFEEDKKLVVSEEQNPVDQLIFSHIKLAQNFNSIITVQTSGAGIDFATLSGISKYFIKQNGLTELTPTEFEINLLYPIQKTFKDFKTKSEFEDFVSGTFLPNIILNSPTYLFNTGNIASAHTYLIENLGLLYPLNTSQYPIGTYPTQPSALLTRLLVDNLYEGIPITLNEVIKAYTEFIWKNYSSLRTAKTLDLIPTQFLSSTGEYTSGTQQLDKAKTLIDIVYSPLTIDRGDFRVRNAFQEFLNLNDFEVEVLKRGPFSKFVQAISYGMYDVNSDVDNLSILYDINNCSKQNLVLLAQFIGLELIGNDESVWRRQLKSAIAYYKSRGTMQGLVNVVNSVFGDTGYDVSSKIKFQYESYIPNILYFCLATESPVFSSFSSWNRDTAKSAGIQEYSDKDMDLNIRYVLDNILLGAYIRFPDKFKIGTTAFDSNTIYTYRDRQINIPPWELIKYYRYCEIDIKLLNYFEEKLVCFGVDKDVAASSMQYIKDNTIDALTDIGYKNNWLFFTSAATVPPNYDQIVNNFQKQKTKYISLWNGKSSTFNVTLAASDFTYNKYESALNLSEGFKFLTRSIHSGSPAHSIPNINLTVFGVDESDFADFTCQEYQSSLADSFDLFYSTAPNLGSLTSFESNDITFDYFFDDNYTTNNPNNISRTTFRRRNLKNILPKDGWYNRTGFNMPTYQPSLNNHSYKILGYIPSSNSFMPVSSHNNIPDVYGICENNTANTTYNGVTTSTTFRCRGASSLDDSTCIRYATRGETHPIFFVIFKTITNREYEKFTSALTDKLYLASFGDFSDYADVAQSKTNEASAFNNANVYSNFEFGRGLSKLAFAYFNKYYTYGIPDEYNRKIGGYNILSHTYGPHIFNGLFTELDLGNPTLSQIITSSYDNEIRMTSEDGGVFSDSGKTYLTQKYIDDGTSVFLTDVEYVNNNILRQVEFVTSPGNSKQNYFSVINIDRSLQDNLTTNFSIGNNLVKIKNTNAVGIPRLRFNLRKTENTLLPNHEFVLTIPSFVGNDFGNYIGGATLGVWIHTNPEDGKFWSWTKNKTWELQDVSSISSTKVINDICIKFVFEKKTPSGLDPVCLKSLSENVPLVNIKNLSKDLMQNNIVEFNTLNNFCVSGGYTGGSVHKENQSYVIEVFMLPDNTGESYLLIEELNMYDKTFNTFAEEYSPKDLRTILLFFRELGSGSHTRSITNSSLAGSRLSYKIRPEMEGPSPSSKQYTSITAY